MKNLILFPRQLDRSRYKGSISIILFSIAILIIFPRYFYNNYADNVSPIDNGWSKALSFFLTHKDHYSWGRDVVYTYGPLGFLSTRSVPPGIGVTQFIFDLYLVCCYLIILMMMLNANYPVKKMLLFIAVLVTGLWEPTLLLGIFGILVLFFLHTHRKHYWLSYFICINATLALYIKLNTLPVAACTLCLLYYLLFTNAKKRVILLTILLLTISNYFLSSQLNISFSNYFSTAFDSVRYYSYSMYAFNHAYKAIFYCCAGLLICTFGFTIYLVLFKLNPAKRFFITSLICNIAMMMFLLFKEGFTRLDRGHYNQFLCLFPLLTFCLYLVMPFFNRFYCAITLASMACTLLFSAVVLQKGYAGNIPLFSGPAPLKNYVNQLFKFKAASVNDITGQYTGKSYDYFSNQCTNQSYNKNINWHNRPAFQSIVAVSKNLDSLNAEYYAGSAAPDTLFYDNLTVDNRNPLWDDPQCRWVVFSRYTFLHMDSLGQFVLIKRQIPLHQTSELLLDTVVEFNRTVNIPRTDSGIITMTADVKVKWIGNLRALLFQPPHVDIVLKNSKTTDTFRYIPALFNNEHLIVNYSPTENTSTNANRWSPVLTRELLTDFNSVKATNTSFLFQTDMPSGVETKTRIRFYRTTLQ